MFRIPPSTPQSNWLVIPPTTISLNQPNLVVKLSASAVPLRTTTVSFPYASDVPEANFSDDFNPDDMFSDPNSNTNSKKDSSASSEESLTADEVYISKPVTYAYDAYQERLEKQKAAGTGPNSDTSHNAPPRPRPGTEAFRA